MPSQFGHQQHRVHQDDDEDMTTFGHFRPLREQRVVRAEVMQDRGLLSTADQSPHHQQREPDRRHQITDGSVKQVKARDRTEPFGTQELEMLQIALTPAAVPQHMVDQSGRRLFI